MSIQVNQVYAEGTDSATRWYRILHVDFVGGRVVYIDTHDPIAEPVEVDRERFAEWVSASHLAITSTEPFPRIYLTDDEISEKHRRRRDSAWERLGKVFDDPRIYSRQPRVAILRKQALAMQCSEAQLRKDLRRYWQRGLCRNALLPDFLNCGAPGITRINEGGNRLGRKPGLSGGGMTLTAQDVVNCRLGYERYFLKKRLSLRQAYNKTMFDYYCSLDHTGKRVLLPADKRPTYRQFVYQARKHANIDADNRVRRGRRHDLEDRPILASTRAASFGPGSVYLVDASPSRIALVSHFDRTALLGSFTDYKVLDLFSGMIVAFLAYPGPACTDGFAQVLRLAAQRKGQIFSGLNLNYTDTDLPCAGLPAKLSCDNGSEYTSTLTNALPAGLGVDFVNMAAYRPDLRGSIERSFRTDIQDMIDTLPGAANPQKQRGDTDPIKSAKLTQPEYTRLMWASIAVRNRLSLIKDYPLDRDMVDQQVRPIPLVLWNWGVSHRPNALRSVDEEALRLSFLPRASARVTGRGLVFKKLKYSCPTAIREGWFTKARRAGSFYKRIRWDPNGLVDTIWIHISATQLEEATLLPESEGRSHLTWYGVEEARKNLERVRYEIESDRLQADRGVDELRTEVIANATAAQNQHKKRAKSTRTGKRQSVRSNKKVDARLTQMQRAEQAGSDAISPYGVTHMNFSPMAAKHEDILEELSHDDDLEARP